MIISYESVYNPMVRPVFSDGKCTTPEGVTFEAKRSKGGLPKSFWETYSSFANTHGGCIALGVSESEDGLVVEGVPDVDGTLKGLWNNLNNREKVSVNLLSDADVTVQDVDGKKVILVDVPRASRMDRPVFLDGNDRNTFRRQNDGDYKCDPEEIRSMISDSLSGTTDRVPIRTSEIEDLDRDTIKSYRNSLRTLKPEHPWNRCDDTEFLRRIGAAVRDGDTVRPTMAGLLMFGESYLIQSEMVNYHLDYRQYHEGNDWSYRLSSGDGEWSGNVFDFYIAVMNHARTTIGRPFAISGDMRRVEGSPVDVCIREMLINALVNADYRGRGGVVVELRPGSFTTRNPGTFRIPLEEAEEGGISDPRNRTMSIMFSLIGLVERAGTGIPRMRQACRDVGLPDPRFSEDYEPERVTVTLSLIGRQEEDDLESSILRLISSDGRISMDEMSRRLGVSRSAVIRTIDRLKDRGVLSREGGTRGRWVLSGKRRYPITDTGSSGAVHSH